MLVASRNTTAIFINLTDATDTSLSKPGFHIILPTDFLSSSLAKELVSQLTSTKPHGQSLGQLGSFIHFIPARVGHNDCLDAAVKCLCSAYSTFLSSNGPADSKCYPKALQSLRQCLFNDEAALSSEVLCAVVCLSWYEVGYVVMMFVRLAFNHVTVTSKQSRSLLASSYFWLCQVDPTSRT